MIHRSAPGKAAGQTAAVPSQTGQIDLPQGVLVLPQIEDDLLLSGQRQQVLLHGQIAVGVAGIDAKTAQLHILQRGCGRP